MAQSQKNMREIIVQTNGLATETTLKTFQASASDGEIQILSKSGAAAASGVPFVVARKTGDGLILTDVVNPKKIKSLVQKAYAAEVQKSLGISQISVPATAGDKYEYQVDIRLVNYGSLSVENFKLYHGHHVLTQTSTPLTAESAVDALVLNLNRNLSKEAGATATTNPLFVFSKGASSQTLTVTTAPTVSGNATVVLNGANVTVALLNTDTTSGAATKIAAAIDAVAGFTATASGAVVTVTDDAGKLFTISYNPGTTASAATIAIVGSAAGLTITAKAQPLEIGKKEGRPLEFEATIKITKVGDEAFGVPSALVSVITPGFVGVGTGKQVAIMEDFYRGNRGDVFRGLNFPYNWPTTTKRFSDPAGTYDLIEISYTEEGDGINQIELDKSIVIAIPVAQDADAVKARIDLFR